MEKYIFRKDGTRYHPRSISKADYFTASYGDILAEYSPQDTVLYKYIYSGSASYSGQRYSNVYSLKNTINYHFPEGSECHFDKIVNTPKSLVCLNSLHLAGGLQRGTISAKIFATGSLIDTATDSRENGILYNKNDEEVGFVLYKEGFFFFTGSQIIVNSSSNIIVTEENDVTEESDAYKWHHFMASTNYDIRTTLDYQAINITPTHMTFVYADKQQLNHSNNPTYIKSGSYSPVAGSRYFIENEAVDGESVLEVKNTTQSPFNAAKAPLEKQTFISKIGLYDANKKLIATAHLANPILKNANREFLFKLKLDL
jgi:hypothetical protein